MLRVAVKVPTDTVTRTCTPSDPAEPILLEIDGSEVEVDGDPIDFA